MKGIDVSVYQGIINWPAVKAAGIEFAIVRAGYGSSISQKDRRFDQNMQGAIAAGVHVGAYWFSYAYTVAQARAEARVFMQALQPYKGRVSFPVCFDWEYDSDRYARQNGVTPTRALITDMAIAFLGELEAGGWYAMNYLNQDYYKNKFDIPRMGPYDSWLADYSGGPNYPCGIQQTGSTGRVSGISGNVDTDTAFRDYPSIIQGAGLNGYTSGSKPAPAPAPEPTPAPDPTPAPSTGIKVGDKVMITGKSYATGQQIPEWVKSQQHIVNKFSDDGTQALLGHPSGINSWVYLKDLRGSSSAAKIDRGSKVRVRSGATTYTGGGLALFVYEEVYDVLNVDGDRVVIGKGSAVTAAVKLSDLTLA